QRREGALSPGRRYVGGCTGVDAGGERDPPGVLDGGGAAGQGQGAKRAEAPVALEAGEEELAAPELAVVAESGAVEDGGEDRRGSSVLGANGGDVGVVVLHRNAGQAAFEGVARRAVVGMEVVGDGQRHDPGQRFQPGDVLEEALPRSLAGEIPDVRGEVGLPTRS